MGARSRQARRGLQGDAGDEVILDATTIRVRHGAMIFRHGCAYGAGELLAVLPADAVALIEQGLAQAV